jgi:hypothetical protein
VLQSSHKIFSLEKLLAEKGIMTSLSTEVQYMDCCQYNRPLVVVISSGVEDREYFDIVGLILYLNTLIYNSFDNVLHLLVGSAV